MQWKWSFSMQTDGRTDGGTDMKKFVIVLRNFANFLINSIQLLINYENPVFRK
jgi:hypothetical protein